MREFGKEKNSAFINPDNPMSLANVDKLDQAKLEANPSYP